MKSLILSIVSVILFPTISHGVTVTECFGPDSFKSLVCSDNQLMDKVNKFNHLFLAIYSTSPSHAQINNALITKKQLRSDVLICRNSSKDPSFCLDKALDNATDKLKNQYPEINLEFLPEIECHTSAISKKPYLEEKYKKEVLGCLLNEAIRLDDGISSVSEIARMVEQSCKTKATEYVTFLWDTVSLTDVLEPIQGLKPGSVNIIAHEEFGADVASQYILEARASKRDAQSKPVNRSKPH